ncbi:MAG: hypothetical protein PF518_17525 [Spirochaetaceae bacterium]|nr:hypothetical protein [Spirochaetaceae bacterium]
MKYVRDILMTIVKRPLKDTSRLGYKGFKEEYTQICEAVLII